MNGKLSVLLASGFTLMGLEMLKAKYPIEGHRPTEVYTNEEGTINIAFNHTQNRGIVGAIGGSLGGKKLGESLIIKKGQ